MTIAKRFALTLAITFILLANGQAQTPRMATVNISPDSDKVHISAIGDVYEMKIEVSDEQGDVVFQSGEIKGQELEWKMRDSAGERVAAGTYLITATFRNVAGRLRKRVEQVTVAEDEQSDTKPATTNAPQAIQATVTTTGGVTAGRIPKFANSSQITNSVITERAGKIGVGTAAPTSTLTVVGALTNNAAFSASNNSPGGIGVKGVSNNATGIGVWGLHMAAGGTTPAVKGETNSTAGGAVAVLGLVKSSNAGNQSVGVLGVNQGSGFDGYGVKGRHAGAGTGVYGSASDGGTGVSGIGGSYGVGGYSDSGSGVVGSSSTGYGVEGYSSNSYGVVGTSNSFRGVYGKSTAGKGVYGESSTGEAVYGESTSGVGVFGRSTNTDGVVGESRSNAHAGVAGTHPGSGNGIYGESLGGGYAGYFAGNVHVNGTLSKGGGSFKIDHPLDPANKTLSHSFVESPDMMNIYNGNVTLDGKGRAVVVMPAYFNALNKEFRYQLTAIGQPAPRLYIAEEMTGNRFKIAGGRAGMKVSWMVTGIRQDAYAEAHRISVEEEKPEGERGSYLHPELFGKPEEKGFTGALNPALMKKIKEEERKAQVPPSAKQ